MVENHVENDMVMAFTREMLITHLPSPDFLCHLYLCLYLTIYMKRGQQKGQVHFYKHQHSKLTLEAHLCKTV